MKFIHTADWHLGNKMHEIERKQEFAAYLQWLKETIVKENAETLVIAGDVFDISNPPTEARAQYISFLASILGTCCKNVIVVGGNHDSGSLLDSEKSILEFLNIHVIGTLANLEADQMVFELFDKDGNVNAICAAVPFARENELRNFYDGDDESGKFSDNAYEALYKKVLEAAKKLEAGRNLPIIATGHLYAADLEGRFEGLQTESSGDDGRRKLDVVGKLGSVHAGIFPSEFDYVALGHIHYTTLVGKNPKIRYSGSPFVLGFDEADLPRHILSVEVEKGKPCAVSKIEVPKTVIYRRISGDCNTLKAELKKYNSIQEKPVYLELYYKKEDGINIHDELAEVISEIEANNVFVISRKVQDVKNLMNMEGLSYHEADEVSELTPEEIFATLILSKFPEDLSDLDEEKAEKRKKEILNKYLPFFQEEFNKLENGDSSENK